MDVRQEVADGARRRVLVVDDEADIRELLDLTLARMGLDADCAANLAAARERPAGGRHQLCLTDMRLPAGEGRRSEGPRGGKEGRRGSRAQRPERGTRRA